MARSFEMDKHIGRDNSATSCHWKRYIPIVHTQIYTQASRRGEKIMTFSVGVLLCSMSDRRLELVFYHTPATNIHLFSNSCP